MPVSVIILMLNRWRHQWVDGTLWVDDLLRLCQAGGVGMPVKGPRSAKDSGYSKVVQDVLESAVQQSMTDSGESCVCHICSAQLKNATILRDHIRGAHLAIKAHRCNICGESFQWPMQVSRHKKRVHGDGNQLMIFQWHGTCTTLLIF